MNVEDIEKVIPLYINYYNEHEGSQWTKETTYRRIRQVLTREDALCLIQEEDSQVIGFAMGYFEQYDDIMAYDLVEVVIGYEYQNKGRGTKFMQELERLVKKKGGSMIQLQAVNDEMHEKFYGKMNYQACSNLVLKSKWL